MNRLWTSLCLLLAASFSVVAQVGDLPRSTPEQEGVHPALIRNLYHTLDTCSEVDVHHMMILRHGKVIDEVHATPYQATDKHLLYSASKTVTALAVGLAVDDGLLSVDDKVSKYLRDKMPETLSPALDSLTVRNLLMMAAGRKEDTRIVTSKVDWLTTWFKGDFHNVGKQFSYDSLVTYALAMIVRRVTGKPMLEYLRERIFTPLHITDAEWELGADSVEVGGWGLLLDTESQAKLGQLMLQGGKWNGKQLVSGQWIHDMTQRYLRTSLNPPAKLSLFERFKKWLRGVKNYIVSLFTGCNNSNYFAGYGYQTKAVLKPWGEAFFAAGYGGQLIYVMPKCDLVIVINGRALSYGVELNAFYDCIVVPLLRDDVPTPSTAMTCLDTIKPPQGAATHELEKRLFASRLELEDNLLGLSAIEISPMGKDRHFVMTDTLGAVQALAANGEWRITTSGDRPFYVAESAYRLLEIHGPFRSAAAYAWQGDTLVFRLDWLGGGDNRRMKMAFDGDQVTVFACDDYDEDLTDTIHGTIKPRR